MNQLSGAIILFVFLLSGTAVAKIDLNNVTILNASKVVRPDSTQDTTGGGGVTPSGNIKVYGGTAGDACTGATTCNNCTSSNQPCNAARISPDSYLRFEFQTDNASAITTASTLFLKVDSGTEAKIVPESGHYSTYLAVNSTIFIEVRWSVLCGQVGAGNACENSTSSVKQVQVGISSGSDSTLEEFFTVDLYVAGSSSADNQFFTPCPDLNSPTESDGAYCYVEIARGDEKVYIHNDAHLGNFNLSPGGVPYRYLRVYYKEGAKVCSDSQFHTTVNADPSIPFKDLTFTGVDGSFTLDENIITGLENDTRYYFRFANVDDAGNVYYFSADADEGTKTFLTCDKHSAIPAEVVGLLDGKECFIATAAYGTSQAPQLDILREFRDRFLKTNAIGRWLVTKYYTYSPKWAHKIKKRETVRAVVRGTLSPIISMAQWVILYGLRSFLLLSAIGFILGFFVMRRLMRDHD
jgi:hypothetical protein